MPAKKEGKEEKDKGDSEKKKKHIKVGPFIATGFEISPVYDKAEEKKYGKRPEAELRHTYKLTVKGENKEIQVVLNDSNLATFRLVVGALLQSF